ncbi:solute carrier family 22 member 6-like [Tenrec ecaudatus]|uniref:solute carrier family 22 member 6-like n=1 Tax=Tenrec ecaudatus TaxID=94439 RepID=UPI003F59DFDC
MAFNDLLQQVGGVGRFQRTQVTLITLFMLLLFAHNILQNFTAAIPTHHCRPPAATNLSQDGGLEAWLPRDRKGRPESCLRFTSPQWGPPSANGTETNVTGATEPCADGWIYNDSTFSSTIVTEWDLVCTHKHLPQLSQAIYMAGLAIGNLVLGILADRLGRQKLLSWAYLQLAVAGSCAALAPNFPTYCVCRFLCAMAVNGINCNSLTLSLEWLPIHARPVLGLLIGLFPSLGQLVLAGGAYAIPQWRHLQLMVSLPFFGSFICSRFFIESALWLTTSGKLDLALKTLQKVAQINGKQEEGAKLNVEVLQASLQKDLPMSRGQASMFQLLCCPAIRRLSLCLLPLCVTIFFSFFGIVLSLQSLGMNIYLIQVFFGIVDLPFYFLSFWTTKSLGRRLNQMGTMVVSGICIMACALVPLDQLFLRVLLAVLGKGCIAASFNSLLIYIGELYPTVMRQRGLSLLLILANVGSTLSPLLAMTADFYPPLPLLMYGAVPVAASSITVLLPETLGQPLPNTVQEIENRWKKKSRQKKQEQQMVPLRSQPQGAATPGNQVFGSLETQPAPREAVELRTPTDPLQAHGTLNPTTPSDLRHPQDGLNQAAGQTDTPDAKPALNGRTAAALPKASGPADC